MQDHFVRDESHSRYRILALPVSEGDDGRKSRLVPVRKPIAVEAVAGESDPKSRVWCAGSPLADETLLVGSGQDLGGGTGPSFAQELVHRQAAEQCGVTRGKMRDHGTYDVVEALGGEQNYPG